MELRQEDKMRHDTRWVRRICLIAGLWGGLQSAAGAEEERLAPGHPGLKTPVGVKSGGRLGGYTKKACEGPHMKLVAATYFGTKGAEGFVATGSLPDGTIVAFGNAAGPDFPASPAPIVLGRGQHTGKPAMIQDAKGRETFDRNNPDLGGMIVCYSEDLQKIKRVIKLDWGVGSILGGMITGDGKSLVIGGRCGPAFASLAQACQTVQKLPYQAPPAGDPAKSKKVKAPDPATLCDVYVARLSPEGKPAWIWILEKNGDPPDDLFTDKKGQIWFDARGLRRVSADGKEMALHSPRTGTGTSKWLGVDPEDGTAYFGGDRNTNTGAQPYRQPYFYKIDATDKKAYILWEPPPREVGSLPGAAHLESDSSPRAMAIGKDGHFIITGWSDGGNSVFPRQALDFKKPASGGGMRLECSGMKGANSLGHIMHIDPKTQETKTHMWWACYVPTWFAEARTRGAPNGIGIKQVVVADDGAVAVTGGAASGLIQTPGCFWEDPMSGDKYGGEYLSVFRPDMSNLRFSSYLPGCADVRLGASKKGVIAVSASRGADAAAKPTPSPVWKAVQKDFGGPLDAHILLLEGPDS
jgi:hypothetical protein